MSSQGSGRRIGWGALLLVLSCLAPLAAQAAATGKIGGKVVATDTGEPLGFADVLLLPADTTVRKVGGLTNADGTFLLEAPVGRWSLRIRALSYATKTFEGIVISDGQLLPLNTAMAPEALQQEEVVIEAKRAANTEASMLSARRKASSLGDAVSAEQVRKTADKDAAEVLRRVTGMSVNDGKFVFVRGLGERYSSTEVDGVRIASPEQNKRVVPLDLVPSNLLENIVVQKTYTADRPGEFGGGDVQVRTRDFPGHRSWTFSVSQGWADGVTNQDRKIYGSFNGDAWGFGAPDRAMPGAVAGIPIPGRSAESLPFLQDAAKSFANVWTPGNTRTLPNGSYTATYGDELKLFGRPLGVIQSWSYSRTFDHQQESQRFFRAASDTTYDYDVTRWAETGQLGGLGALSYRISPAHAIHLRGLFTNTGEDEVRIYEGQDHNSTEAFSNEWQNRRNTRLMYVQRSVLSGALEGNHELEGLGNAAVDWKFGLSHARRQEPDRREVTYNRQYYFEGDTAHWTLASRGAREYGELNDEGWGGTLKSAVPFKVGTLSQGKVAFGVDRQVKDRDNSYRRFWMLVDPRYANTEAPPESIFAPGTFEGPNGGWLEEFTNNDPQIGVDNYRAQQRISAAFLNVDLTMGSRVRGNLGVRVEHGYQNVESFALFDPATVLVAGKIDNTDWLPSMNVTWAMSRTTNLRVAASRTLSRPDLNELSPSAFPEYIGGFYVKGNPNLHRALLDNYDLRIEAFPGISEVLAAGVFYKQLHEPIETVIQGGSTALLIPENSARGHNQGIELEARIGLGRVWTPLQLFTFNSNASIIASEVALYPRVSRTGTTEHPLQGQADYLVNLGLGYGIPGRLDATIMMNAIGRRLRMLGYDPLPDIYDQPMKSLDATLSMQVLRSSRVRLAARNLYDPTIRRLQGTREVSSYRTGRSYSVAITMVGP